MTDLPHHPTDELASAHLDGATSDAETRVVEGDPALVERVAELRAVREAVRMADVPVDGQRRELAIAAALSSADQAPAPVALLDEARARRSPRRLQLIGAAAAVAAAAVLLPRLLGDDDRSSTTVALPEADSGQSKEAASTFGTDAADAAGQGTGGQESALDASSPPASAPLTVDLGTVTDLDQLAQAVRAQLEAPTAATAPEGAAAEAEQRATCAATLQGEEAGTGGTAIFTAVAAIDGRPVLAIVFLQPDDRRVLRVADVADCAQLDTRPL